MKLNLKGKKRNKINRIKRGQKSCAMTVRVTDTGCIEGYPEPENHIRKAYKRTNIMNVFCT